MNGRTSGAGQLTFDLGPDLDVVEFMGRRYLTIRCPEPGCDNSWPSEVPVRQWIEHLPPLTNHLGENVPNHYIHWGQPQERAA